MSSRSRIDVAMVGIAALALAACHRQRDDKVRTAPDRPGVITSALLPGEASSLVTDDAGGGGMGPSLMDNVWIYGGRLAQIHQTLAEGRPNGMPSWGGKVPDDQLWQIATYVRSLSLPATIAANTGDTPGQHPAPVPRSVDAHNGWAPPPGTTNDYGVTTEGPK